MSFKLVLKLPSACLFKNRLYNPSEFLNLFQPAQTARICKWPTRSFEMRSRWSTQQTYFHQSLGLYSSCHWGIGEQDHSDWEAWGRATWARREEAQGRGTSAQMYAEKTWTEAPSDCVLEVEILKKMNAQRKDAELVQWIVLLSRDMFSCNTAASAARGYSWAGATGSHAPSSQEVIDGLAFIVCAWGFDGKEHVNCWSVGKALSKG